MADTGTITILIGGMTCQHCVASVKKKLSEMSGVDGVDVDLRKGQATVKGSDLDAAALRAAVEELGFDAG